MSISSIKDNLAKINENLGGASLVAVSKFVDSSKVVEAIKAGQKIFGENYVQEAKKKKQELLALGYKDFDFHLIGAMQSNKTKDAVGLFSLIHSVDRISLAKAIAKEALKKSITQDILIQINVSKESTKSGVSEKGFEELLDSCLNFDALKVRGIMSIGSYGQSNIKEFEKMKLIFDKYQDKFAEKKELSMGMSSDYKLAIEHGATIVRVGTSIFGSRT